MRFNSTEMENTFDERAATWDENPKRMELIEQAVRELRNKIELKPHMHLLDYGCGTGLLGFSLAEDVAETTFCDTSTGMLEQVKAKAERRPDLKVHVETTNLCERPFEVPFDVAVSLLVLHHVENLDALFANLNQSLKLGGRFCWIDLVEEDGSFHGESVVPHNGFSKEQVFGLFEAHGFRVETYSTEISRKKEVNGAWRDFPLFLAVGQKDR